MELYSDVDILKGIGEKVKALRTQRKTSQAELAEFCGLNRRTIYLFEKGKTISLLSFIRILRYFDLQEDILTLFPSDQMIDPFNVD